MFRFLATAVMLVATSGGPFTAFADPSPPSGWSASASDEQIVYRPRANPSVELRVYPAETVARGLDSWFASRLERGVAGFSDVEWGETTRFRENTLTSVGQTGSRSKMQVVVATGCEPELGKRRYAELIVPADEAKLPQYAEQAAGVLAQLCMPVPAQSPAAASSGTTAPQAPGPATINTQQKPKTGVPTARVLSESEIEGVLYSFRQVYTITGLQFMEYTYLLLKDGAARRDVPDAAPADFDLQADRASGSQEWGRWKRTGGKIQLDFGDGFETPEGQMMRVPGKRGERLQGKYQKASSYSMGMGGAASWAFWGLQLDRDGNFERERWGGAGASSGSGSSATTGMTVYDEKGSTTTLSGGSAAIGTSNSTGVTDDDLTGTYHIDGWTLELRYKNGEVTRGFFFTDPERDNIWFEGHELMKTKPGR